jgi:hypothetical protein
VLYFQTKISQLKASPFPWDQVMSWQFEACEALRRADPDQAQLCADTMLTILPDAKNVLNMYWVISYGIARERSALKDFVEATKTITDSNPLYMSFKAAHTMALCEAGNYDFARKQLVEFGPKLASLQQDFGYPVTLTLLADCSRHLNDRELARSLIGLLEPFRGQMIVAGVGGFVYGAADRFLGIVHGLDGQLELASQFFESALFQERRIGAFSLASATAHARDQFF